MAFKDLLLGVALGKRDENTLTTMAGRLTRLDRQISGKEAETIKKVSGGKSLAQLSAALLEACDPDKVEAASRRLSDSDEEAYVIEIASYFDPLSPVEITKANLPHWKQEGATYFITFRLADSLPEEKLEQWRHERDEWLNHHPLPLSKQDEAEYHKRFSGRIENWLDHNHGSCILDIPECRAIVEDALQFFDKQRYILGDFVVASNHVHVLVTPLPGHDPSDILHSWKSFTSKEIIKTRPASDRLRGFWDNVHERRVAKANVEAASRRSRVEPTKVEAASRRFSSSSSPQYTQPQYQRPVWQKESYDHIVRSEAALRKIQQYIRSHSAWTEKRRDAASTLMDRARTVLVNDACAPFDSPVLRDTLTRVKHETEQTIDTVTVDTVLGHDYSSAAKEKGSGVDPDLPGTH
jgi:REP element-mobilizing transposase RayT